MADYSAVARRALAAIAKKGGPVTFPGAGTPATYDPATDTWSGGSAGSDAVGRAVQIDGDPDELIALNLVNVDNVTLMIAASGLTITPAVGLTFEWAGRSYTIKKKDEVAPDGTAIVYVVTGAR
jgi:hypothetical protein